MPTCLTHCFTDSPPLARKYVVAACWNGCFTGFTILLCKKFNALALVPDDGVHRPPFSVLHFVPSCAVLC